MMATMLEQLAVAPGQVVLEIGAGTGYNAALLAHLLGPTGQVVTLDLDPDIVEAARTHLNSVGSANVTVVEGDGAFGYPLHAPYDRIIVTAGAWDVLPTWQAQLAPTGRLVVPLIILPGYMLSVALERRDGVLQSVSTAWCGFMPLRGDATPPHRWPQRRTLPRLTVIPKGQLRTEAIIEVRVEKPATELVLQWPPDDSGSAY